MRRTQCTSQSTTQPATQSTIESTIESTTDSIIQSVDKPILRVSHAMLCQEAPKRYADTKFSEEWLAFVPAPRTLSPEAESTIDSIIQSVDKPILRVLRKFGVSVTFGGLPGARRQVIAKTLIFQLSGINFRSLGRWGVKHSVKH